MMQVFQVGNDDYQAVHDGCAGCKRKVRPGQWVMHCMVLDGSFTKRNMQVHVDCVRNAIDDVPDVRGMLAHTTREELVRLREAL